LHNNKQRKETAAAAAAEAIIQLVMPFVTEVSSLICPFLSVLESRQSACQVPLDLFY